MKPFLGTYINKVDSKGRSSVPARWRVAVAESDFPGVVCFPSFTVGAIEGVTMDRMAELSETIDQEFDLFADAHGAFATSILADSFELPFDNDGRILLPEDLLEHADIENRVAFVGMGKRFQIWQPEAYGRFRDEAREQARNQRELFKSRKTKAQPAGGGRVSHD